MINTLTDPPADSTAANALKVDLTSAKYSIFKRIWATYKNTPFKFKLGLAIIVFFVLLSVIGPFVAPYNPNANITSSAGVNLAPSATHLLGTDSTGEDVLSQVLIGTGPTILLGLITGVIATSFSVIVGLLAGYYGGIADEIISLFTNVFLVIPALPLLIVLVAFIQGGNITMALVLSVLGWPWGARVIRAQTMSLRNQDFVAAAKETGESSLRIMLVEILPKLVSIIASSFIFTVLYAIAASVGLMYLGLGDVNSITLGGMLFNASNQSAFILNEYWWYLPPGLIIAVFGMGLVLLNYGLDEIGNPRLRDASKRQKIGKRNIRPSDPTPVLALLNRQVGLFGRISKLPFEEEAGKNKSKKHSLYGRA